MKEIKRKDLASRYIEYQINCERYYLHKLRKCPLIVDLMDCFDDHDKTVTVLKFADKGDIDTFIEKWGLVDFQLARYFTIQIISAVNRSFHTILLYHLL